MARKVSRPQLEGKSRNKSDLLKELYQACDEVIAGYLGYHGPDTLEVTPLYN